MKNIKLESFGVFGFDGYTEQWFGFSDGNNWNGFATPLFTKETLIKIRDCWDEEFNETKRESIPRIKVNNRGVFFSNDREEHYEKICCHKSDYGNLYRITDLTWKRYDYISLDGDIYFKEDVDCVPDLGWEVTKIQPEDGMVSLELVDNDGEMYFENDKFKMWRDEMFTYRTDIHITNLES